MVIGGGFDRGVLLRRHHDADGDRSQLGPIFLRPPSDALFGALHSGPPLRFHEMESHLAKEQPKSSASPFVGPSPDTVLNVVLISP